MWISRFKDFVLCSGQGRILFFEKVSNLSGKTGDYFTFILNLCKGACLLINFEN